MKMEMKKMRNSKANKKENQKEEMIKKLRVNKIIK